MKKIFISLFFASAFLSAKPITYYALDNETIATSDEIFNDPFLALRTKTTGPETTYSTTEAWSNLANFNFPEWKSIETTQGADETLDLSSQTSTSVITSIFDHTSPCFILSATATTCKKVHWQISDNIDFNHVVPNFDEIRPFTEEITLSAIDQTFLKNEKTYYFHAKILTDFGWTKWSQPLAFQVVKPNQPQNVVCENIGNNQYQISWCFDPDPNTSYILFGADTAAFIPSIYDESSFNLLKETSDNKIIVDDSLSYYRVVATSQKSYSNPSELVVATDFQDLTNTLDPAFNNITAAYPYNPHVERNLWEKLKPDFLPSNHPARQMLDKIFKVKKRVIESISSLKKAGFRKPQARQWTRLIVTSHKKLPGYIVKLYTDSQHPHRKRPEWYFWTKRIRGVNLIRKTIEERGLQAIFKTPKKWIYPIPHTGSTSGKYRKNFILVEEDMDILDDKANEAKWRSPYVTKELLNLLFPILQDLGLWDCPKPANIPFGKDGRIAFIDTQSYHTWPVKLFRLTPFLAPSLQPHWEGLIKSIQ